MGPLSSLEVISYRLPIVIIGLSLTVFAVLRLVTDGRQMELVQQKTRSQAVARIAVSRPYCLTAPLGVT